MTPGHAACLPVCLRNTCTEVAVPCCDACGWVRLCYTSSQQVYVCPHHRHRERHTQRHRHTQTHTHTHAQTDRQADTHHFLALSVCTHPWGTSMPGVAPVPHTRHHLLVDLDPSRIQFGSMARAADSWGSPPMVQVDSNEIQDPDPEPNDSRPHDAMNQVNEHLWREDFLHRLLL